MTLNPDVREKMADLTAAGHSANPTDMIISLFCAYNTATNEDFKSAITYWKNEWSSKVWSTPEELMNRADNKYMELFCLRTWGKKLQKDDQIVALTAQMKELTKVTSTSKGNQSGSSESKDAKDKKNAKWKYDKNMSSTNKLETNNKEYNWCMGPGHKGIGMWVLHKPGTCTNQLDQEKTMCMNYTVSTHRPYCPGVTRVITEFLMK